MYIDIYTHPDRYPFVGPNVLMEESGLPYMRLWKTGVLYDHIRRKERYPGSHGAIEFTNILDGSNFTTHIKMLIGYYFDAPWRTPFQLPYRKLDFMGCSNYYVRSNGDIFSTNRMVYLKPKINTDGYHVVALSDDTMKSVYISVHRIVAMAFVYNPENKPQVNHIDGNKTNNWTHNLEWTYNWENMLHASTIGLRKSMLSDDTVRLICQKICDGYSNLQISKMIGVELYKINDIRNRSCYYRISKDFTF